MLLIQHIKIYWDKSCRGAPYAIDRSHISKGYQLPKTFYYNTAIGYPLHYLYLQQDKDGFKEVINRTERITDFDNVRVGALEIITESDSYKVNYRYDFHRAIPERLKYSNEISMYTPLNETAFTLAQGEYGRVIYNGRYTDFDCGIWYYNLDIINIKNITEPSNLDVFINEEPQKEYKQMAYLH